MPVFMPFYGMMESKSQNSGSQIFGESEFSMSLSDPFIFEPNQRFTVDVTETS